MIQVFIRSAGENDFRCNVHQGGKISYILTEEIPFKIKQISNKIINYLDEDKDLFTLDFIISNEGNVYLLEGNCGPGVNWDLTDKTDTKMTKKLIRQIVTELSQRTLSNLSTN